MILASWGHRCCQLRIAIALGMSAAIAFSNNCVLAQITPDATLGAEGSVVTPNVNVRELPADRIDGGAARGTSLFHSFSEFNVTDGQRVYFANPAGIETILSRVTGNTLSNILGTLGVDGGASLFFLNPNGIVFGENARLDVTGSFVASTANSLLLDNGFEFSATNPAAPPLLTLNVTPGLQYGSNYAGATITNAGNLSVGQDLTLFAENLNLQGQLWAGRDLTLQATDTVRVRDSVASPFRAVARGELLVKGDRVVDIFALNHPESGFFSVEDMMLRSANTVGGDAHYWSGGSFRVEKLDGTLGNLFSPYDPIIRSLGDVSFNNYEGTSLHILAAGQVNIPGLVTITQPETGSVGIDYLVEDVALSDGTVVPINGNRQPTFDVRAGVNPSAIGTPGVTGQGFFDSFYRNFFLIRIPENPTLSFTPTSANITIGSIDVPGSNGLILLTNQYQPNLTLPGGNIQVGGVNARSDTGNGGSVFIDSRGSLTINPGFISSRSSVGNSGDITIVARDAVSLGGDAYLGSSTDGARSRNAGNITISSGSLLVNPGSFLDASTRGIGDAGNININVRDRVSLIGSSILNNVESGAVGNGGTIAIRAGSLLLDGTAVLQADTGGQGNAGNIFVRVNDSVTLTNGGLISSNVRSTGVGNSGRIEINASGSVNLSGFNLIEQYFSGLLANTKVGASGHAGTITVNTGTFRVAEGAVVDVSTLNSGAGGSITVNADRLELTTGGQIFAFTTSSGNAGNINLDIEDSVTISGSEPTFSTRSSGILTSNYLGSTGNGGNISLRTRQLDIEDGGQITTAATGTGNAGDLSITATNSVNVRNQGIITTASTDAGNGGTLFISTGQLNVSDRAEVNTTSLGTGNAGNLAIRAADSMNVSNEALLTTGTGESSTGNGGNLSIATRRLDVTDRGGITTASLGTGIGGNLAIAATDSINVVNGSFLATSPDQTGIAGSIFIETGRFSIRDSSQVVTSTLSTSNAGDLTVRASDAIEVVNGSKLSADTLGSSNGGNLSIETQNLRIQDSEVSTGTFPNSSGWGGTLSVRASDSVEINGFGGLVTATDGSGRGGDLIVQTQRLTVRDGGRVEAGTAGIGKGGDVTVNASESIELSGGSIADSLASGVSARSGDRGNAGSGNVSLTTEELIVRDGAEVTSETSGAGNGGDVRVQANSLFLTNGGSIASRSAGLGLAGDISVNLSDTLQSRGGIISAASLQAGGGDIDITARDIRLRDRSLISTSVSDATGGGGNIRIRSDIFLALEDSDILANADAGPGGDITINSPVFLADLFSSGRAVAVGRNPGNFARFRGNGQVDISDNFAEFQSNAQVDISDDFAEFRGNDRVDISADSRSGLPGRVSYPNVDPSRGVAQLPSDLVDATALIDRRCTPGDSAQNSSFIVTGRGGMPPSPFNALESNAVVSNWLSLDLDSQEETTPKSIAPTPTIPTQIVEAQGWVKTSNGTIILTTQVPSVTPHSSGLTSPSCQSVQTSF